LPTTETVTVLFTDLVGSTALANRLDPADADALRREHFSTLRQAIALNEGTEIKNLGDGLMVAFSRPSAALACAVAMQQAVDRDVQGGGPEVSIRIGLGVGEATFEDGDWFGDPVVEAARLCARADGGRILATALVRGMAGRRAGQSFVGMGPLELKGIPDPVDVVEVLWEPDAGAAGGVPLPGRLTTKPDLGMFGRDGELHALRERYKSVANGDGREIALCSGEAGIGKSTLVGEVSRRVFDEGAIVLYGHCDEDVGLPYQPFAEALGHYATFAPEEELRAHVATYGADLARIVPALARRMPDVTLGALEDLDTEKAVLFASVAALLTTVGTTSPVVLVLEDLQWADRPSLLLLRHLATWADPMRLLVLATFRESDVGFGHPLGETIAALHREPRVTRVSLSGLADSDVVAWLEHGAGHEMDGAGVALAHELRRETEGNPFFVGELLHHLSENGLVRQEHGRWVASVDVGSIGLPQSVREVVGQRVARLGERVRGVLANAAVVGREFDVDVLARLVGEDENDVLDQLDAAMGAALVTEVPDRLGRYAFTHALFQHTLYQDLSLTRRARLHRRIAEVLDNLYGDQADAPVAELAHHWTQAVQPVDAGKALEYSRRAGDDALAKLAPDEASRWYEEALRLVEQGVDADPLARCDLLIGVGTARRQSGDEYRAPLRDAFALARAAGDVDRMARAALANSRGSVTHMGHTQWEWIAELEEVLTALDEDDGSVRAMLLAALGAELMFEDADRARALARDARAVASRLDEPAVELRVLNVTHLTLSEPASLPDRMTSTTRAVELASRLADPVGSAFAALYRAWTCLETGDLDGFERSLDAADAQARRVTLPFVAWQVALGRCLREMLRGDGGAAEAAANEALRVGSEGGVPEALVDYGVQMLVIRTMQGRAAEFVDVLAGAVTEYGSMPGLRAGLSALYCELDRDDEARAIFDEDAARDFADIPVDTMWLAAMTSLAQTATHLRAVDAAKVLYDLMLPWADQVVNAIVAVQGLVALALGQLALTFGDLDAADAHLADAYVLAHDRLAAPYWTAQVQLSWGATLLLRGGAGDASRAATLLAGARDACATHGFVTLARRVDALTGRH
jgi:class 3 adenylate cyclase